MKIELAIQVGNALSRNARSTAKCEKKIVLLKFSAYSIISIFLYIFLKFIIILFFVSSDTEPRHRDRYAS